MPNKKKIPVGLINGYEKDFVQRKIPGGFYGSTKDSKRAFVAFNDGETKDLAYKDDVNDLAESQQMLSKTVNGQGEDLDTALDLAQRAIHHIRRSDDGTEIYSFDAEDNEIDTISGLVGIGGGGGSGSGEGSGSGTGSSTVEGYDFKVTNASGFITKKIAAGQPLYLAFNFSSTVLGEPTGEGAVVVYISGALQYSDSCPQGLVVLPDFSSKLNPGYKSTIRVIVTDAYDKTAELRYTISCEDIRYTWTLTPQTVHNAPWTLYTTPYGDADKILHYSLDGVEMETVTTSVSGTRVAKAIPALTHGAHTIETWFIADINGSLIESVHLKSEFIYDAGETTPIIILIDPAESVAQYSTLGTSYVVYDPLNAQASISLSVDGVTVSEITVDRTPQVWSYQVMGAEDLTMEIDCRGTSREFAIEVVPSEYPIEMIEDGLVFALSAAGRSNGEANPALWSYGNVAATFSGFSWITDGWILDSNNHTMLSVAAGDTVTIPFEIFANDFRSTGFTLEVDMSTSMIRNYDTPVFSCWSGGRGFRLTAQQMEFHSAEKGITYPFKEDERIRVGVTVTRRQDGSLIFLYLNGEMCQVTNYERDDDFSQLSPVGISIGSPDCTVNIYGIRVYNIELNRRQMLTNYIASKGDADEMLALYQENDIFDTNGNVAASKLPMDLWYDVIDYSGTHMPAYKGDKVTVDIYHYDRVTPSENYVANGTQLDVQGTSSQWLPRKNYKAKSKNGITQNGKAVSGVALDPGDMLVSEFTYKKDYASSDLAHNTVLSGWYTDICPYKTPMQLEDPKVRQTIKGKPCVLFNTSDGATLNFIGCYNKNLDKGTSKVFGFKDPHQVVEIKNNTDDLVLFMTDDFESLDASGDPLYLGAFEWLYPDGWTDPAMMKELWSFVVSCDPDNATNEALDEPVTYDGVTYSDDTGEYRIAKFRAEAGNYFELESVFAYKVFSDVELLMDNRAKNMFPAFAGSPIE